MAVGGGLILVGNAGALGAAFFIAAAVPTPVTVVAINAAVIGSHMLPDIITDWD
jgi:serine acetyltransferase